METGQIAKLESFLLDKMVETRLPGVSFALIEHGHVVYARGLGFRDIERRLPVTPQTLFGIGSITKVFTALAIMQLQDRGLLDINDPVSRYMDLAVATGGEPIRIRHFLAHTSGIPALGYSESKMSDRWFMTGFPIADDRDLLAFMRGVEDWVHAQPGERWFYLNEGYIVLGSIIERISGQAYIDYVAEHILRPLGLARSFFRRADVEDEADYATPYLCDRAGRLFVGSNLYSEIPAAGGLVSSLEDMARFALLFLQTEPVLKGHPVVSQAALQLMMEPAGRHLYWPDDNRHGFVHALDAPSSAPSTVAGNEPGGSDPYAPAYTAYHGHGLQIYENFYGHKVIGHGGGVMGGTSYLACIPEREVGVVLLANGHGYPLGELAMYALAGLLGHDPDRLPFIIRDRLLGELCGAYESFRGTIAAKVTRRQELLELQIHFHHEDRTIPLIPVALDEHAPRFVTLANGRPMAVEFVRTEERVDLVYERYKFRKC
jgi:CubicO group peptidase (beta-lactamase class C family)